MPVPSSPNIPRANRRSNISTSSSAYSWGVPPQMPCQRTSHAPSRRSSQSSIHTVATSYSINSSATSTSVCSAKFERAFVNQSHKWTSTVPSIVRNPSVTSQFSTRSGRSIPPHVVGKRSTLQKQLEVVETLLRDTPGLVMNETGSIGWLLAHEKYLLNVSIKYDERAMSEWEASQDWHMSAQEGPVSKIFVTQPSRFGLTPEQHKYRIGQARTLGNNALDLWRFSDLNYQDAFRMRGAREKLQAEQAKGRTENGPAVVESTAKDEQAQPEKEKLAKTDFQTWLREVSKNNEEESKSVMVKDDGSVSVVPSATALATSEGTLGTTVAGGKPLE